MMLLETLTVASAYSGLWAAGIIEQHNHRGQHKRQITVQTDALQGTYQALFRYVYAASIVCKVETKGILAEREKD